MKTLNKIISITLLFFIVSIVTAKNTDAASPKKTVLIHVVSNIKTNDGPPCVAFDMALAYLKLGYKVDMMFDADAAWNLKISSKDKKNDFDRYEVPADLKKIIYEQTKDDNINKLKTFGDFLSYLNSSGVNVYVNGTWNVLTSVEKTLKGKTNMPSYSIPLNLKEMAKVFNSANTYIKY